MDRKGRVYDPHLRKLSTKNAKKITRALRYSTPCFPIQPPRLFGIAPKSVCDWVMHQQFGQRNTLGYLILYTIDKYHFKCQNNSTVMK